MSRWTDRNVPAWIRQAVLGTPYTCGVTVAGPGCGQAVPAGHCHLCHGPGADSLDHLVARSLGGRSTLDNLAPAHVPCNARRAASRAGRAVPVIVVPW